MEKPSKSRGFTLIELIMVVVIIALLSGIILASLSGSRGKARDGQRVSDLGQLQLALSLYFDRCGQYPTTLSTSASNGCPSGITLGSYIAQIPTPPTGTSQSDYSPYYTKYYIPNSSGTPVNYILVALLESNNTIMAKSLMAASIYNPSDIRSGSTPGWWSPANTTPYTMCGTAWTSGSKTYYVYCLGPN